MFELFSIGLAFVLGLAIKQLGLPPLIGFLAAGFGLNWLGQHFAMVPAYTGEVLDHVAHLGVLLLLFTVGLKLKLRQLGQAAVLGGSLIHFTLSVAIFGLGLYWLHPVDSATAVLLGVALAFSSTVLAAKILQNKRELTLFHGRIAIGILIVQDLLALAALSLFGDQTPTPWALLVFALPLLRPVLYWLVDLCGHDEMLVLMGMLVATVLGGMGFELVGLSSELGALVMGVLLGAHARAGDVAESLWGLKELFLVGFFLQIGMSGLPGVGDWLLALGLIAALPLKFAMFFFILTFFHLRARNAFLSAMALSAYSEFGLIVAAGIPALNDWLVPLALTVSLSFALAAPANRAAHRLFERCEWILNRFQRHTAHPDELPPNLANARALVFGMGRTGTAAYERLGQKLDELVGLDADPFRVARHQARGRRVILADAEDTDFWRLVDLGCLQVVVLAMDDLEAKLISVRKLRERGFTGPIISHALYSEHAEQIRAAGANETYLTMHEAGLSLAGHALRCLNLDRSDRVSSH